MAAHTRGPAPAGGDLAGAPARERWLAADLLRVVRRRRRSGLMFVAVWLGVAAGATVGLLVGDARLSYAVSLALLSLTGVLFGSLLGARSRTLVAALEDAGLR